MSFSQCSAALRSPPAGTSYQSALVPAHICRSRSIADHHKACRPRGNFHAPRRRQLQICQTYPIPETEKERSSVDTPQEWTTPPPSRRPDPLPEFEKLETPPPRKMPGDPEQPDEEEEEEKKKEPKPEEEPEEQPEAPPSEE